MQRRWPRAMLVSCFLLDAGAGSATSVRRARLLRAGYTSRYRPPVSIARTMFASDYSDARARFRRACGARTVALPLSVRGPSGEALAIDVAWLGPRTARRVVLVTSGLHGVEGFAGSAVQCALLATPPALAPDCALVLVHALNPWGFAHL